MVRKISRSYKLKTMSEIQWVIGLKFFFSDLTFVASEFKILSLREE